MGVAKIDIMVLPRIAHALELSMASLGMVLGQVGSEFKNGIRKHTPRSSGKLFYKCKVIKVRTTPYTGRVSVGWLRKDFQRKKFYAVFIGEGTGIYGKPPYKVITSNKGKKPLMRYEYKGKWVSMKSVKGIRPRHMLEKGYKEALPTAGALLMRTFYHTMRVQKRTPY